jgi:hypothetical protein
MTHYENLFQSLCVGTIPASAANKLATELSMAKDRSNTNSKSIEALAGAVSELSAELTDLKLAANSTQGNDPVKWPAWFLAAIGNTVRTQVKNDVTALREDFEDFRSDTIKDINELSDITEDILGRLGADDETKTSVRLDDHGYEFLTVKDSIAGRDGLTVRIEESGYPTLAGNGRLVFHAEYATGIDKAAYMTLRDYCDGFYGILDAPAAAPENRGRLGEDVQMTLKLDTTEFQKALAEAREAVEKSLGDDWGTVLENVMSRLEELEAFDELATKDIGRLFEFMRDSKKSASEPVAPFPQPEEWTGDLRISSKAGRYYKDYIRVEYEGATPGYGLLVVYDGDDEEYSAGFFTPAELDKLSRAAASLAAHIRSGGN